MNRSSLNLDPETTRLLVEIAQTEHGQISYRALTEFHAAAGEQLLAAGLLQKCDDAVTTTFTGDDSDEAVPLIKPDGPTVDGYFDPQVGWVLPDANTFALYQLDFDAVIARLISSLEPVGKAPFVVLVPGQLWEAGSFRVPGRTRPTPIWIARGLSDPRIWDAFLVLAHKRPSPGLRLVLDFGGRTSKSQTPPSGHQILALSDVVDYADGLCVNAAILANRLRGNPNDEDQPHVSADGGVVSTKGVSHEFRGDKQRLVVNQLSVAWRGRDRKLRTAEVLLEAGYNLSVSRLSEAFKGHPTWKQIIHEAGGFCWMEL